MRTIDKEYDEDDDSVKMVDHSDSISLVLDEIDEQLSKYGLEVVMYDTGDDSYVWEIRERE